MEQKKEKRIADPILSDRCNLAGTCIFNSHICFIICFFESFFLICRAAYLCLAGF